MLEAQELERLAAQFGVTRELHAHGFFGGHVETAWTLRVLVRRGRSFDEYLLLELDEGSRRGIERQQGEAVVVSCTSFEVNGETGPVAISDRRISMSQDGRAEWLSDAVSTILVPDWATDSPRVKSHIEVNGADSSSREYPGPFSQSVQMQRLGLAPREGLMLISFVAYATATYGVREVIGCCMGETIHDVRPDVSRFITSLLEPSEAQWAEPVVYQAGPAGVGVGTPMVQIRRKGSFTTSDYLERFVIP